MPHTYLQDVKTIVDNLSTDRGLALEERLIVLAMMKEYVAIVTRKLEDELSTFES